MGENENVGQAELTNRIQEMIEGESPEVLQEILNLVTYHTAYQAGVVDGADDFEHIISKPIGELIR